MPPAVPIRQWVLTLPFPLRYRVAFDHQLQSAILCLFLGAVFRWLRHVRRPAPPHRRHHRLAGYPLHPEAAGSVARPPPRAPARAPPQSPLDFADPAW